MAVVIRAYSMAVVNSSVSHSDLSCLPIISGETIDKFIKFHCIANDTVFFENNIFMILKVISVDSSVLSSVGYT